MGEALILRHGGGGLLSVKRPIVRVTAETGSTVSISFGGITLKTLGPDKAIASTTSNLSYYFFSVRDFGTYTVTATKGGETSTGTVAVSEVKEYEIRLWYDIILFNSGTRHPEYTANNANYSGNLLRVYTWMYYSPVIDVTKFTKLDFTVTAKAGHYHLFGLVRNPIQSYPGYDGSSAGYAVWKGGADGIDAGTYSLNISGLTGNYYVQSTNSNYQETSRLDISYIRLY